VRLVLNAYPEAIFLTDRSGGTPLDYVLQMDQTRRLKRIPFDVLKVVLNCFEIDGINTLWERIVPLKWDL